MKLVMLGKPLCGKGTQAALLAKKLHIPHIAIGDLLRKEIAKKSSLGKRAAAFVVHGKLVPDTIILSFLKNKITGKKSFILDGFPRTIEQAGALEKICALDLVVEVDCSQALIRKRLASRLVCSGCGAVYGLHMQAKKKNVCNACKGVLVQRKDDTLAALKVRMASYSKQTKPLLAYYKRKGLFFQVSGEEKISLVQKKILKKIISL